jgi:hypothetical protein
MRFAHLVEVYYSAFDLNIYHTALNCPVGKSIDERFSRRAFFPLPLSRKCETCTKLEDQRITNDVFPVSVCDCVDTVSALP